MQPPPPEQFLEWTFPYHLSGGMFFAYFCSQSVIGIFLIPFALLVPYTLKIVVTVIAVGFLVGFLLYMGAIFLLVPYKPPNRKLRIDRQKITMTDTHTLGTKERRMKTDGAKFFAVCLGFFERLFTVDPYRTCSAYHIKIARSGEAFLFPCIDEREQSQIINTMKEWCTEPHNTTDYRLPTTDY